MVQVWVCECRIPVTASITSATRASVHISVGKPFARGPFASAASTSANCPSVSRRARPARPPPTNPARPPCCHARYHRDAVCAETPSLVTTST